LFTLFATSVVDPRGKFSSGVVDSGGNLPPELLTPISMTLAVPLAKFTPNVVVTVVHLDFRISPRILEKFEVTQMLFSGDWEKMIREKT
jgi:hypothetical protein